MSTLTETRTITVAHSPDSDDAFMFYGLATNKLDTGNLSFTHVLKDIQTLNEEAFRGTYDVTAISFHAYAYISDNYVWASPGFAGACQSLRHIQLENCRTRNSNQRLPRIANI